MSPKELEPKSKVTSTSIPLIRLAQYAIFTNNPYVD